jgi:hypothetical protein
MYGAGTAGLPTDDATLTSGDMNRLDDTVRSIIEAHDEYEAVRRLIMGRDMNDFYTDTLHYPVGVEFEFERMVMLLVSVDNPKGKLHFAVEI